MIKTILTAVAAVSVLTLGSTGIAQAGPAMCADHSDHSDMANGYHSPDRYVTACGGGSGPDADGNNATAPHVSTEAS